MPHIGRMPPCVRRFLTASVLAAALASPAPGQSPQPGDVQRLVVITLSMQVGSTGTETRHVTYTPPPGWYVRSHQVECTRKTGNSSFSVATVPQDWRWVSTEKVEESYRTLIDMAARSMSVR